MADASSASITFNSGKLPQEIYNMISKFLDKPSRQAMISTSKQMAWHFREYNWKELRFCERARNMIPALQAFCGMETVEFSNVTVRALLMLVIPEHPSPDGPALPLLGTNPWNAAVDYPQELHIDEGVLASVMVRVITKLVGIKYLGLDMAYMGQRECTALVDGIVTARDNEMLEVLYMRCQFNFPCRTAFFERFPALKALDLQIATTDKPWTAAVRNLTRHSVVQAAIAAHGQTLERLALSIDLSNWHAEDQLHTLARSFVRLRWLIVNDHFSIAWDDPPHEYIRSKIPALAPALRRLRDLERLVIQAPKDLTMPGNQPDNLDQAAEDESYKSVIRELAGEVPNLRIIAIRITWPHYYELTRMAGGREEFSKKSCGSRARACGLWPIGVREQDHELR